jgi:hypothetical protein
MSIERIMEKIQKCFALSKSSNAGEAANALRQAQAMMRIHNISEDEIGLMGYTEQKVSLPVQVNKKHPVYIARMNALIRKAFGVATVIEHEMRVSDKSYAIRIFGPKNRVPLAAYAYAVMFREMNKGWTQYIANNPHLVGVRGGRTGFLLGWIESVDETIVDFGANKEEVDGTEALKLQYYDGSLRNVSPNALRVLSSTLSAGNAAGADFRLHRPMGGVERIKISN